MVEVVEEVEVVEVEEVKGAAQPSAMAESLVLAGCAGG